MRCVLRYRKGDLTGWTINFAGKMKTEELDAATVSILKTPENAQTPIELPEEEEARKTPPPEPVVPTEKPLEKSGGAEDGGVEDGRSLV